MAAIIELNYFNSYWIKRVATGDLCRDIIAANSSGVDTTYTVTNNKPTFTWPGPINDGDAEVQPAFPTDSLCTDLQTGSPSFMNQNYYLEESRIRGGYNNTSTDLGVKAYLNEKNPLQKSRTNALIYSGLLNSNTNFNATNSFPIGDSITKAVNPENGSIQKLYAEDTNLIVFQEDKVSRALIDKDAIYSAEGGGSITSSNLVIGQIVPYVGDYGISNNPESFAVYGYRKYFTDVNRNAVMRLSRDGLTEISNYGMVDYFRDSLNTFKLNSNSKVTSIAVTNTSIKEDNTTLVLNNINTLNLIDVGSIITIDAGGGNVTSAGFVVSIAVNKAGYGTTVPNINQMVVKSNINLPTLQLGDTISFVSQTKPRILGGWDIYTKQYHLSLQTGDSYWSTQNQNTFNTLAFDESVLGWTSFFSYNPSFMSSLKNSFYSTNQGSLYKHNVDTGFNRERFYGIRTPAEVTFVFNPQPDLSKNFLTMSYEGTNGWQCTSMVSEAQTPTAGYSDGYDFSNFNSYVDTISPIRSYIEGAYDSTPVGNGGPFYGVNILTLPIHRAGFDLKENYYVASIKSNSPTRPKEIQFLGVNTNEQAAGIKANFATVTFRTDDSTQVGGMKELFAVSTTFSRSGF
jgi:hypothetical protein